MNPLATTLTLTCFMQTIKLNRTFFAYFQITIHKRVSLTDRQIDSVLEVQDADLDDAGVYVCRTSELLVESKRVDVLNGTHFCTWFISFQYVVHCVLYTVTFIVLCIVTLMCLWYTV